MGERITAPGRPAEAALARIRERDGEIHALLALTERRAAAQLAAVEARLARGETLPLAGAPVLVKDNIAVSGEKLTCASRMLEAYTAPYDATVVRRLEAAGALILGKTNLDEFAMGSTGETSCFGPARNPHDLRRSPGGSSSGSAAALAAGYTRLALGTDTGGSARLPAAWCGVWALKPSYGAVSRYGMVAFASSLEQICPMAASGAELALLTDVIAGPDGRDATCVGLPAPCRGQRLSLEGVSVGLPTPLLRDLSPAVGRAVEEAIRTLEGLGARVETAALPSLDLALAAYICISAAEAGSNLARFDGMRCGLPGRGENFAAAARDSRARGFGREVKARLLLGTCVLSGDFLEKTYRNALRARTLLRRELTEALETRRFLLCPAVQCTAPLLGAPRRPEYDRCCVAANLSGLPAAAFPWGMDENSLPVGLQLMGRAFDDGALIAAARAMRGED